MWQALRLSGYEFRRAELSLYASFDAAVASDLSLKSMQRHFEYLNDSIHFPMLDTPQWEVHDGAFDTVLRRGDTRVEWTGVRDGRVQGRVSGRIEPFSGSAKDSRCYVMDVLAPADCFLRVAADIPFDIEFDLPLEATEELDCADPSLRDRCG